MKWNNGKPLTPADVAFTYNLVKANAAINLAGLQISSVSTSGSTVTLTFPSAQYTNLQQIAGVPILPQSQWGSAGSPSSFTDPNPVGTGPYKLKSFTPQGFTLTKNPSYWQSSLVKVQNVFFPVYTSNTGALSALFTGKIDWTGNFIPGLDKNFVSTAPQYHHFWEAPGSTNALMPNLHKWPTNQLPVRQAISAAINRNLLASEGEAGLENPVTNATGLTLPTFNAWSGPIASQTVSATGSATTAAGILAKAGYKKNSAGFYALNGKEVDVTLVSPSAYTDYAAVGSMVAQELKSAGINANFQGLTVTAWNADMANGNFQLAEHWSNNGLTPYNLYDNWLNSSLATGNNATGDYERLARIRTMDAALAKLAGDQTVDAADERPGPDRDLRRPEPAGHPRHHRLGVVRVQLAAVRRVAHPAEPVRDRTAVRHEQLVWLRHGRGGHPPPQPEQVVQSVEAGPPPAHRGRACRAFRPRACTPGRLGTVITAFNRLLLRLYRLHLQTREIAARIAAHSPEFRKWASAGGRRR